MRILILGQHGSGKSTLAQALSRSLLLPTISTGRMFRDIAAQPTPVGRSVQHYLETGTYLPDEVVIPLVHERLGQPDVQKGFILEGYPRTRAQAEALQIPIDVIFHLQLTDDLSRQRLLGRHRDEDTVEVIARRLRKYHEEASLLIDYYRKNGRLVELDARLPATKVAVEALTALNEVQDD